MWDIGMHKRNEAVLPVTEWRLVLTPIDERQMTAVCLLAAA